MQENPELLKILQRQEGRQRINKIEMPGILHVGEIISKTPSLEINKTKVGVVGLMRRRWRMVKVTPIK